MLVISNLKLLARLLPELYSTRTNYYYLLLECYAEIILIVYFDWLPLNVFQCDWCPCGCCLILTLFVYPFPKAGARGWVLDTAGHGGHSILPGLGCWPNVGLIWVPDHHL